MGRGQVTLESPGVRKREGGPGCLQKVCGDYFFIYHQVVWLTRLSHRCPEGGRPRSRKALGFFSQTPGSEEEKCVGPKQAGHCSWTPWRKS